MSVSEKGSLHLVAVEPAACEFNVTGSEWDDISIVVWNELDVAKARNRVAAFVNELARRNIEGAQEGP